MLYTGRDFWASQKLLKPSFLPVLGCGSGWRFRARFFLWRSENLASVGLASSLDRNYRECVRFEIRARYLESNVGSGKLKDGLDGDQQQLQKELDHCRLQGKLKLGKAREAERAMRRGAFAKFDIEDALLQTKRDPSACLDLPVKAKKRKEIPAVSNAGAEASSSTEQHR